MASEREMHDVIGVGKTESKRKMHDLGRIRKSSVRKRDAFICENKSVSVI